MATRAPQLRGLLQKSLLREIMIGVALSSAAGMAWWFSVVIPRKRRYQEFYKDYDANAVAESMKASFEGE